MNGRRFPGIFYQQGVYLKKKEGWTRMYRG
jgi:hypothetical protein